MKTKTPVLFFFLVLLILIPIIGGSVYASPITDNASFDIAYSASFGRGSNTLDQSLSYINYPMMPTDGSPNFNINLTFPACGQDVTIQALFNATAPYTINGISQNITFENANISFYAGLGPSDFGLFYSEPSLGNVSVPFWNITAMDEDCYNNALYAINHSKANPAFGSTDWAYSFDDNLNESAGDEGTMNDTSGGAGTYNTTHAPNSWWGSSLLLPGSGTGYSLDTAWDTFEDDYITSQLNLSTEFWLYPRAITGPEDDIWHKNGVGTGDKHILQYETENDVRIFNEKGGGGQHAISSTASGVPVLSWSHIVVVWGGALNDASTICIYVNGSMDSCSTVANAIPVQGDNTNWQLGFGEDGPLHADLDEFNLFSDNLTATEVKALYNRRSQEQVFAYYNDSNGNELYGVNWTESIIGSGDASPTITIESPLDDTNLTNATWQIIVLPLDDLGILNVSVIVGNTSDDSIDVYSNTSEVSNNTNISIPITLTDGTFNIFVEIWDNATTPQRGISSNITIRRDNAPPSIPVWIHPTGEGDRINVFNYNHSGSIDALSGLDAINLTVYNDTDRFEIINHSNSNFTAPALGDGNYTGILTVNDTLGNSNSTIPISFLVDTVTPIITWATPADDNSTRIDGSLILDISCTDNNQLFNATIRIFNATNATVYYNETSNINTSSYSFVETVNTSAWKPGPYSVELTCEDDHTDKTLWGIDATLKEADKGKELTLDPSDAEGTQIKSNTSLGMHIEGIDSNVDIEVQNYETDGGKTLTSYETSIDRLGDRYKMLLKFTSPEDDYVVRYRIESFKGDIELRDPAIAHFAFDGIWMDWADEIKAGNTLNILKISDKKYYVDVSGVGWKAGDNITLDPNVGPLNNVSETRNLTVYFSATAQNPTNTTVIGLAHDYNLTVERLISSVNASVDNGSNFTLGQISNTVWGNLSGDHANLTEGVHNITFYAVSLQGDINITTIFFTVSVTAPPTPTVTTPFNFSLITGLIQQLPALFNAVADLAVPIAKIILIFAIIAFVVKVFVQVVNAMNLQRIEGRDQP